MEVVSFQMQQEQQKENIFGAESNLKNREKGRRKRRKSSKKKGGKVEEEERKRENINLCNWSTLKIKALTQMTLTLETL